MKEDKKIAEIMKRHQPLTEWLSAIGHEKADEIRREDSSKRERLRVLNAHIDLPFDEPVQFEAQELADKTPKFQAYLKQNGSNLCALRLNPKIDGIPKPRMRGLSVKGAYEWFLELDIDPQSYQADFVPHTTNDNWATMFIVSEDGISGEIIPGALSQLSAGYYDTDPAVPWRYDFKKWQFSGPLSKEGKQYLKELIEKIRVSDKNLQRTLNSELGASFANNYIVGFFEACDTKDYGTWFKDYSPLLGQILSIGEIINHVDNRQALVNGQAAFKGIAKGVVKVPTKQDEQITKDEILVCEMTTPDAVDNMQKAAAIVTDHGGILSHAAIVARELKKPCIVGTQHATKVLKTGWFVTVNADQGTVHRTPAV